MVTQTDVLIRKIKTGTWSDARIAVDQLSTLADNGDTQAHEWLQRYAPWMLNSYTINH